MLLVAAHLLLHVGETGGEVEHLRLQTGTAREQTFGVRIGRGGDRGRRNRIVLEACRVVNFRHRNDLRHAGRCFGTHFGRRFGWQVGHWLARHFGRDLVRHLGHHRHSHERDLRRGNGHGGGCFAAEQEAIDGRTDACQGQAETQFRPRI